MEPLVEPFRYDTQHRCSHSSPESPPESPHLQFRPLVEGGRGEVHTAYVVGDSSALVRSRSHCHPFRDVVTAHIAAIHRYLLSGDVLNVRVRSKTDTPHTGILHS